MRSRNGFSIKNLGEHKLLFISNNKSEVDRVLQQEPWSFDKHLIVIQRFCKDTPLKDLKLQESSFWIQVHNIPLSYMDREIVEDICAVAGRVVQTTGEAEFGGGGFIRVRVIVDVTWPIFQGRVVTLENGKKT